MYSPSFPPSLPPSGMASVQLRCSRFSVLLVEMEMSGCDCLPLSSLRSPNPRPLTWNHAQKETWKEFSQRWKKHVSRRGCLVPKSVSLIKTYINLTTNEAGID